MECRSPARFRVHPDPSAVVLDDPLADGHADAGARILLPGVEALENNEDTLRVLRVDADAVVPHGEQPLAVPLLGPDVDLRGLRRGT